jgi:MurNAc alpha-1-phosphate uridylyltransferase
VRALLLAAGRGERMRPLTDTCPKPLLRAGPKRLIEYHLLALARAGIDQVVINLAYLGGQIRAALDDGRHYGVHIRYSDEGAQALETAGGIVQALPLLGEQPFLVVNADIWSDYDFKKAHLPPGRQAHLVLVDNPAHNPGGDFCLQGDAVRPVGQPRLTFSGIGIYSPALFVERQPGPAPLAPLLRQIIYKGVVSGEHFCGRWIDIGTQERLQALHHELCDQQST